MARHRADTLTLPQREPALVVGTLTAFTGAVIGLLVAFGADVTPDQQEAVLAAIPATVGLILLVAALTRPRVTPNAKVVEAVEPDGTHVAGPASPLPTGTVVPLTRAGGA